MFRIAGAVLIIACSGAMGFGAVLRLREHEAALNALIASFDIMECEIAERCTPLPELMGLLAEQSLYPVSVFFSCVSHGISTPDAGHFADIWSKAVMAAYKLRLEPNEALALIQLGRSLGRYSAEKQLDIIRRTRACFAAFANQACEIKRRDSKMHAFLGVAAGLSVVVILL
ncbi:MAG: stage III sporulation protein AB [Oscillospiraceae bacterium]|nr:stage III sporulation protein AB [Oscillospiraceae bacterium]